MQSDDGDHFDLLPFINIMVCVLGSMLVMTLSIAGLDLRKPAASWLMGSECCDARQPPMVMEWDGSALLAHYPDRILRFDIARRSAGLSQEALGQVLAKLRSERRSYVLIAVRPNGFSTLHDLKLAFRGAGISIGAQPVHNSEEVRSVELENPHGE